MKARRVRCVKCAELTAQREIYPTKTGPTCRDCWETGVRKETRAKIYESEESSNPGYQLSRPPSNRKRKGT